MVLLPWAIIGIICFGGGILLIIEVILLYLETSPNLNPTENVAETKSSDRGMRPMLLYIIEICAAGALFAIGFVFVIITPIAAAFTLALAVIGIGFATVLLIHGIIRIVVKPILSSVVSPDGTPIGTFETSRIPTRAGQEKTYILKLGKAVKPKDN